MRWDKKESVLLRICNYAKTHFPMFVSYIKTLYAYLTRPCLAAFCMRILVKKYLSDIICEPCRSGS